MLVKKALAVLVLVLFTFSIYAAAAPPAQAHRVWSVVAGGGTRDVSVVANAFYPRTIEVAVGDTVAWHFQGFHQVAFLGGEPLPPLAVPEGDKLYVNPKVAFPAGGKSYAGAGFANSGLPPEDPQAMAKFGYALTFTKAGTYPYLCIIHGPAMSGTIVVKARATGSPAAVARKVPGLQAATIRAGQRAWAAQKPEHQGATVIVPLVGNPQAGYTILRFTREPLVVPAGTTVTWEMRDPFEIHTVTFWGTGKPPAFIIPQPQPQGPPKLLLNPQVTTPTARKSFDGMGYVNSGILYPPGAPAPLPKSYSLTFTKAGRYTYVCVTHAELGMYGIIVVK